MSDAPAIAVLEIASIARGHLVLDAMDKRATVTVCVAEHVSPGRFWIAVQGSEADVHEALRAGIFAADRSLMDSVYLAGAHPTVLALIAGEGPVAPPRESLGTLELATIVSAIRALDAALKEARVSLVAAHLGRGIGGHAYFVLTGSQGDVEAALEEGARRAGEGTVLGRELIANPEQAVRSAFG